MYDVEWHEDAYKELRSLPAYQRSKLVDAVEKHLMHEPMRETEKKKLITDMVPPWSDIVEPFWQLRVDPYRLLYDVFQDEKKIVIVMAVRLKPHGRRTEEIL